MLPFLFSLPHFQPVRALGNGACMLATRAPQLSVKATKSTHQLPHKLDGHITDSLNLSPRQNPGNSRAPNAELPILSKSWYRQDSMEQAMDDYMSNWHDCALGKPVKQVHADVC